MKAASITLALCLAAGAAMASGRVPPVAPGARYVSLGSSYAAGAGIGPLVAQSPKRCGRTENNYAHLLAAELKLDLVDASCGGATTAHILGKWGELPPQIDAVTADTRLVTITIGGNDLNYVRNLMVSTCGRIPDMMPSGGRACPVPMWPSDADYASLERHLRDIAEAVRQRAPAATLVFIDYLRILPDRGGCRTVPLDEKAMADARASYRRMVGITRKAARAEKAVLLPASQISARHDACSAEPWSAGQPGRPASWHPTAAGHAAIAGELAKRLR